MLSTTDWQRLEYSTSIAGSQMDEGYNGMWVGTVGGCAGVKCANVSDVKSWVIRNDMSKEKSDG